jgi:diguanylate cyclase (GGDEF)-like protein
MRVSYACERIKRVPRGADHIPMRRTPLLGRRAGISGRKGSLARRLFLVLAAMLCALAAVAGVRVFTFRATGDALERFRAQTVGQTTRITEVRRLLKRADDVGEAYVETNDPAKGKTFAAIDSEIVHGFRDLEGIGSLSERLLATSARLRWELARETLETALLFPAGDGDRLDPFHTHVDEADAFLADEIALNVNEVGQEIASLGIRERVQLFVSFVILFLGFVLGGLLSRRVYRSITVPLMSLEEAATRLGHDDLSHRIDVRGNDELARVGTAFNSMAEKLQEGRDELQHQALHDTLTGLPNRALFITQLGHAVARSRRKGTPVSVLFLDLDGFKAINDTLGHQAGDELLIDVGERLLGSLREDDTVARLGGDEFGIVLEEELRGARSTAQRIVREFGRPWSSTSDHVPIGVSIGIATRTGEEELDELLRQADTAMYAAKENGKGRWCVYSPDLAMDLGASRSLREELQRAVEKEEFVVHYQPVMDLRTGSVTGVEALVRWNHPQEGLLPPSEFMAEAEVSGHVMHIDQWVLREACRQVRLWQIGIPGADHLAVHVNLSARQLQHAGLAEEIDEVLRVSGLAPSDLTLEITETTLVRDAEAAGIELTKLKELDVRLALDDFGTGFSSLSHLHEFPIDIIKIDRSFVAALSGGGRRTELVKALVGLGRTLGLVVVAEGVEDAAQLEYLRTIACDRGQGFLFARPLPPEQLEMFLTTNGSGDGARIGVRRAASAS